jgi:hypothetical protein
MKTKRKSTKPNKLSQKLESASDRRKTSLFLSESVCAKAQAKLQKSGYKISMSLLVEELLNGYVDGDIT